MAVEQRKIDRFIALAGSGILSINEAGAAAGISHGTADRLMARPDVRARVEELRAQSAVGVLEDVRTTVDALLQATDDRGLPDWTARARGAEILMRHQDAFEEHEVEAAEDALPAGAWTVYPTAYVRED